MTFFRRLFASGSCAPQTRRSARAAAQSAGTWRLFFLPLAHQSHSSAANQTADCKLPFLPLAAFPCVSRTPLAKAPRAAGRPNEQPDGPKWHKDAAGSGPLASSDWPIVFRTWARAEALVNWSLMGKWTLLLVGLHWAALGYSIGSTRQLFGTRTPQTVGRSAGPMERADCSLWAGLMFAQ